MTHAPKHPSPVWSCVSIGWIHEIFLVKLAGCQSLHLHRQYACPRQTWHLWSRSPWVWRPACAGQSVWFCWSCSCSCWSSVWSFCSYLAAWSCWPSCWLSGCPAACSRDRPATLSVYIHTTCILCSHTWQQTLVFLATGRAILLARLGFTGSVSDIFTGMICVSTCMVVGTMVGSDSDISVINGSTVVAILFYRRFESRVE